MISCVPVSDNTHHHQAISQDSLSTQVFHPGLPSLWDSTQICVVVATARESVSLTFLFPATYLFTLSLKAATRFFHACFPLIRKQGGISFSRDTFGRIYISLHLLDRDKEHTHTHSLSSLILKPVVRFFVHATVATRVKDEALSKKTSHSSFIRFAHTDTVQRCSACQPFLCLLLTYTTANRANLRPLRSWLSSSPTSPPSVSLLWLLLGLSVALFLCLVSVCYCSIPLSLSFWCNRSVQLSVFYCYHIPMLLLCFSGQLKIQKYNVSCLFVIDG